MKKTFCAVLIFLGVVVAGTSMQSTIEMARKEKKACTVCHVKVGSAELNAAGRYYAEHGTLVGYPPATPPAVRPEPAAKPAPKPAAKPAPAKPVAVPAAPEAPPAEVEPAKSELLLVLEERVEPAHWQRYEEVTREWVRAAQAANVPAEYSWRTGQKDLFTYYYLFTLHEPRALDPRAFWDGFRQALGAEKLAELERKGEAALRSMTSWVIESLPEMSYQPAASVTQNARFAHVATERVRPGKVAQYEEVLRRLREAWQQANFPYTVWVYRTVTGPAHTYYFVVPAETRAQLAEMYRYYEEVFADVVGAEAWPKLTADWAECLEAFEHWDWTLRPDLSYAPQP